MPVFNYNKKSFHIYKELSRGFEPEILAFWEKLPVVKFFKIKRTDLNDLLSHDSTVENIDDQKVMIIAENFSNDPHLEDIDISWKHYDQDEIENEIQTENQPQFQENFEKKNHYVVSRCTLKKYIQNTAHQPSDNCFATLGKYNDENGKEIICLYILNSHIASWDEKELEVQSYETPNLAYRLLANDRSLLDLNVELLENEKNIITVCLSKNNNIGFRSDHGIGIRIP